MNRYEISFTNFDVDKTEHPHGERVSVGEFDAQNGIEGIRTALRSRGISDEDMATARTLGSNKRLTLAGITFVANKVAS